MRLRALASTLALFLVPVIAHADTYNFSVPLTFGTVGGTTLEGTVDLAFVSSGGSGTGAATSLTFTSVPAGFGSLIDGNVATDWPNQVSNSFTVVNGAVTSYLFFAYGAPGTDGVCLNGTGSEVDSGPYTCLSQLNELESSPGIFGYNEAGLGGITFTPATTSATPEPSSIALLGTGLLGFAGVLRKRFA